MMAENNTVILSDSMNSCDVLRLTRQGKVVLCPKCKQPLLIAVELPIAGKHKVHPGIYCPQNEKHVSILVDRTPPKGFWEQFKDANSGGSSSSTWGKDSSYQ